MSVWGNILKQLNAKVPMDLYQLELKHMVDAMCVGVDTVNDGKRAIVGFTSSYNKAITQFSSKVFYQDLYKEQIYKGQMTKEE